MYQKEWQSPFLFVLDPDMKVEEFLVERLHGEEKERVLYNQVCQQ